MIYQEPVAQAEKANGTSVQGRNNALPGFDSTPMMVNPIQLFSINMAGIQSDGIPQWSYYPQIRDMYLRQLSKKEPIMAGALYSVTSRIKSLRWNIKGGRNSKAYYQDLFAQADGGAGYGQFIGKVVADLLTQDNGAFIELVGPGKADRTLKGRVTELWHLDSHQCWRTFDPEFPVIYINPLDNSYHRMHKTRVIMLSNNPQPDERARNVGFCAVSRALKIMQIIRHIETYKEEKISGKFKRGFIYGNGLTDKQFKQATEIADANSENSNFMVYNEIPVLLSMMQDMKLNMLDLASLPDGFQYKEEIDIYVYILALCFGTDAREFWPATASGATKADASVQHTKAQGKGIGDIIKMLKTAFNWQIMPSNGTAEIEFDETDDEQDKAKADIDTVRITNIGMMQQNGNISAQEGRALLIAQGVIDPKQLVVSEDNDVADDAAPMEDQTAADTLQTDAAPPTTPTPPPVVQAAAARPAAKDCYVLLSLANDPSIIAIQEKLKADYPDVTWEDPADFHVTLVYAKNASDFQQIRNVLPQSINSVTFDVGPTGTFENPDSVPLFLKVSPSPELLALQSGVAASLTSLELELSDYSVAANWQPHITLAYLKPGDDIPSSSKTATVSSKVIKFSVTEDDSFDVQFITKQIMGIANNGKASAGKKAIPVMTHVDAYQKKLKDVATKFVDKVADAPSQFKSASDDLYNEFADLLPGELTDAFGIGLAGAQPTTDGIDRLKKVAQTSHDYFKDSFMVALGAVSLAGLEADEIRATLSPFVDRLGLYAGAFWESIWQGQRDATPESTRVRRVLQSGAQHCATCPDKAGDYESYDDMIAQTGGIPGDGSDDCMSNCRCTLETEDEDGGFSPLVGDPTVFVTPLFEVLR